MAHNLEKHQPFTHRDRERRRRAGNDHRHEDINLPLLANICSTLVDLHPFPTVLKEDCEGREKHPHHAEDHEEDEAEGSAENVLTREKKRRRREGDVRILFHQSFDDAKQ